MVMTDNYPQKKSKKTYEEFLELDQILESKYAKYIRQGLFLKGELPNKANFNFNNLQSIEQFKNQLKVYLDSLSNELSTSINGNDKDDLSSTGLQRQTNFLPRELLLFYNIDMRLIDPIMGL